MSESKVTANMGSELQTVAGKMKYASCG